MQCFREAMKSCFCCNKEIDVDKRPGRLDTCPLCSSDVKVCLNCRFYDEKAPHQCSEPVAEMVLNKDKANYCDYFEFRVSAEKGGEKEDAIKKLKDLFGGS
jgi:hypothetical protein